MADKAYRWKERLTGSSAFQDLSRRLRRLRRVLLLLIVILPGLTIVGVGGAYLYGKMRFHAQGPLPVATAVWLPPGLGVNAITDRLAAANAIDSPGTFRLSVRLSGKAKQLKAGEYEIPAHASMADIVQILVQGKSIVHKVTIPEGLTSQQAMVIVGADPVLTGDMPILPPEGALLPETYNFVKGTTRKQIVVRMQKASTDLVAQLWPKRTQGLPLATPQQAIILASIVEKETALPAERPMVAAAFINRLEKSMRLQSDPTIVYGVNGGKGPLGRPIKRSEIDGLTPYNTYQIDGLPPTPICNPGRASIEAVLNPQKSDALYFVANGTGGHVFSNSLAEHERNVARWRKIENAARLNTPSRLPATSSASK